MIKKTSITFQKLMIYLIIRSLCHFDFKLTLNGGVPKIECYNDEPPVGRNNARVYIIGWLMSFIIIVTFQSRWSL